MDILERKFGKYAIKNLSLVLLCCYGIGYVVSAIDKSGIILNYMSLNPYAIFMRGQVWRVITWIMIPPESFGMLTLISLIFYYSIGRTLERTWGDFTYNLFIFSGMIFTFIAVSLIFVYFLVFQNGLDAQFIAGTGVIDFETFMQVISRYYISTYYINMSIFLAFAATFPEAQVLLMFIIPVKIKYLGFLYAGLLAFECLEGNMITRIIIIASLLNFIVFYYVNKKRFTGGVRMRVKQAARRREFRQDLRREQSGITKHKCAICGRTEQDAAGLEFRFCSKCNGNYEYCSDHLFTHKHIE